MKSATIQNNCFLVLSRIILYRTIEGHTNDVRYIIKRYTKTIFFFISPFLLKSLSNTYNSNFFQLQQRCHDQHKGKKETNQQSFDIHTFTPRYLHNYQLPTHKEAYAFWPDRYIRTAMNVFLSCYSILREVLLLGMLSYPIQHFGLLLFRQKRFFHSSWASKELIRKATLHFGDKGK